MFDEITRVLETSKVHVLNIWRNTLTFLEMKISFGEANQQEKVKGDSVLG